MTAGRLVPNRLPVKQRHQKADADVYHPDTRDKGGGEQANPLVIHKKVWIMNRQPIFVLKYMTRQPHETCFRNISNGQKTEQERVEFFYMTSFNKNQIIRDKQ
jgi:hypothetical protein